MHYNIQGRDLVKNLPFLYRHPHNYNSLEGYLLLSYKDENEDYNLLLVLYLAMV